MKKKVRILMLLMMMAFGFAGSGVLASAAGTSAGTEKATAKRGWVKEGKYTFYYSKKGKMLTGWNKLGKYTYYFRKTADEKGPAGSRMTGFQKIGKYTYYFNKKGVMLTGWRMLGGQAYYFRKTGKAGTLGRMNTGLRKIGKKYYYFGADGAAATGWTKIKDKMYYFSKSKKLETRGSAYTGWHKIGKYKYYFSSKGLRYTSRWIQKKYYVDERGRMLKNCVTPDGYKVNSAGVKGKRMSGWVKSGGHYYYFKSGKKTVGWRKIGGKYYYFDESGIRKLGWVTVNGAKYYLNKSRVTGWHRIDGKRYYFHSDGRLAVNTTVSGRQIGPDGVATGTFVLLIAGHGQGDPGACATIGKTSYQEYKLTREFASKIAGQLSAVNPKIVVSMYDQNYDCYQVLSGKKSGPKPDLSCYDYVLEVHFNATATSGKDLKGDGKRKGIGMYINSGKKDSVIDRSIISAVKKQTGFEVWGRGSGIFTSSGLFNAKTCQGLGVSYGLLETAFIDDKDDIAFYNKHKDAMAKAVAGAISAYFGS